MAATPDYTILSSPRIGAAQFASILRQASSPAAPDAAAAYAAFVNAGVDPTVGLAVFRKESTFGRFGRASHNRSWGNIRGAGPYPLDSGGFRIYPSWSAGAADCARLLAIYGANRIRPGTNTSTVQTFPYVWAPSSDGNAPDRYGDQLAGWIHDWSQLAGNSVDSSGGANTDGTVLKVFNATAAAACTQVTIVAPTHAAQDWTGLYPIPRDLVGKPCVECAKGWVPAIVSVGPVQTIQGFVSPEDAPGQANACVLAGTKPGDRPGAGGVPGQVADNIPAAIAAFGDTLGNIITHGIVLVGLIVIVLLGLYLIATSET